MSVQQSADERTQSAPDYRRTLQRAAELWLRQPAWASPRPRNALLGFLLLFALAYGYLSALQIGRVNQNRASSDQQHNIELARESRADWLPYRTSGVVNPLWPWLAGKLAVSADANDDAANFLRGKWLNVGLTLAFCLGLGLWAAPRLPVLPCITLVSLTGLAAMVQRAPFFQPEPLFYILFFLSTAVGISILLRNTLPRYLAFGVLCGLCYLAKASITPFLGVFLAYSTGIALICLWPRILFFLPSWPTRLAQAGFSWRRHFAGIAVVLGSFALILLPRMIYSAQHFGDPLHSFPKYWMWQDDFGKESVPFMLNFSDLQREAKAGGKPLPSAGVYLREKGMDHFLERLTTGTQNALRNFFQPEKRPPWAKQPKKQKPWEHVLQYRGYYLAALTAWVTCLAVAATISTRRLPTRADAAVPHAVLLTLLVVGSFIVYALAYGLYEVIGKGDRFMLSLYVPLIAALILAERALLQRIPWPQLTLASAAIHGIFLLILCQRIGDITRFPYFQD